MLFYFQRCAIISNFDCDFGRVTATVFSHYNPALCKLSETIDDMKFDPTPDTDSGSENTYSFSEENSDNVTFYRWQIVETKITKSKGSQRNCLKMTSKH